MGHRANYVILDQGVVSLYYSHWGALTVPNDVFWGPNEAEAFIRQQDRVKPDDWLDDVWGEGGVALNKDSQIITLFGGEGLGYPPLQPVFIKLMSALWETHGWSARWADAGMPAIAAAVGVDPTIATAEPIPPIAADLDKVGLTVVDPKTGEFGFACLISTLKNGELTHVVSDYMATPLLANGEDFIQVLSHLPAVQDFYDRWEKPTYFDNQPWSMGDEFSSSIILDLDNHSIAFRELVANPSALGFLSMHWTNWTFERFDGDLNDHFARLKIPTPGPLEPLIEDPPLAKFEVDEDEVIEQIADILLNAEHPKAPTTVRDLVDAHESEGEEIWVNPAGLTDTPAPAVQDRGVIFGKALAALVKMP